MVHVSYRNSYGKVLKNGWVQVDLPCAQKGVKSCLGTFNPSSPKAGCTNPPNGFRPGAQNRTAKG